MCFCVAFVCLSLMICVCGIWSVLSVFAHIRVFACACCWCAYSCVYVCVSLSVSEYDLSVCLFVPVCVCVFVCSDTHLRLV